MANKRYAAEIFIEDIAGKMCFEEAFVYATDLVESDKISVKTYDMLLNLIYKME